MSAQYSSNCRSFGTLQVGYSRIHNAVSLLVQSIDLYAALDVLLPVHTCCYLSVQAVSSWKLAFHPDNTSEDRDRKSTRLNSSHLVISYAVFCLKKK